MGLWLSVCIELWDTVSLFCLAIFTTVLVAHIKGNIAARNFVKSKEYLSLPKFILSTDE